MEAKPLTYCKFVDEYEAFEFEGILLDTKSNKQTYLHADYSAGEMRFETADMPNYSYLVANCKKTKGTNRLDAIEAANLKQKVVELTTGRYKAVYLRELTEAERILYGQKS